MIGIKELRLAEASWNGMVASSNVFLIKCLLFHTLLVG